MSTNTTNNKTDSKEVMPKELTLLVTGTGMRSDETSDQLLFRTCDAALYFDKDNFDKLPHELIDRYNNYQKLLDSNRELLEALENVEWNLSSRTDFSFVQQKCIEHVTKLIDKAKPRCTCQKYKGEDCPIHGRE